MSGTIETSAADGVLTLRMSRPEKKNALTDAMYHALADAMLAGNESGDESVGAVLLTGAGGNFTTGNDIGDFLKASQSGDGSGESGVSRFLIAQIDMAKPFVAAVEGLAIGVGATTLFQCDYVVASETADIRTPFLDLGVVAENGASYLAPRIMGHQRAFEMLCLGEPFGARRAHEAGVVNKVVPAGEAEAEGFAVAKRLAAKPREAMRITRAMLRADPETVRAASKAESAAFGERLKSDEARAAFMAFLSRKKA